jgi:hypothetical protein
MLHRRHRHRRIHVDVDGADFLEHEMMLMYFGGQHH